MGVGGRVAALAQVLGRAVDIDTEAAALQDRNGLERRGGVEAFVRHLESVGGLRPGLTVRGAPRLSPAGGPRA
jgi:hypothetical protein